MCQHPFQHNHQVVSVCSQLAQVPYELDYNKKSSSVVHSTGAVVHSHITPVHKIAPVVAAPVLAAPVIKTYAPALHAPLAYSSAYSHAYSYPALPVAHAPLAYAPHAYSAPWW